MWQTTVRLRLKVGSELQAASNEAVQNVPSKDSRTDIANFI
jgi:hypothetical protein